MTIDFHSFWQMLPLKIKPGTTVKNWTALKGYLGDEFTIVSVSAKAVEIDHPQGKTRAAGFTPGLGSNLR